MDIDLKVKPIKIPLSTPGLTLSMDDIEALKAKIAYLENQTNGVNINIIQDLQAQIHYLTKILKDHGIE